MGSKYTVQVWVRYSCPLESGYHYEVYWAGQSLPLALLNLWRAVRKSSAGCVTLECR